MLGLDVTGDIHDYADALTPLHTAMGYGVQGDVYRHPCAPPCS